MKRLLSLILAAVMIISLLPAVTLAADTREELTYSFLKSDNANVANATLISYETGNGLLAYFEHNTNHRTSNDFGNWDGSVASPRFSMHDWGNRGTRYNYAAYKMKGIQPGEYTVTLEHAVNPNGTQDVEMYILAGDTTDVKSAIDDTSNIPVLSDINMYAATAGKASASGRFTAEKDGEYLLVFIRRSTEGAQCVIPKKLILTPYVEPAAPEYSETVHDLPDIELVGKEISFTAKMMMTDGTVFVPSAEGDGITVSVLNGDMAELAAESYENGVYSATLKTLGVGEARLCFTSTVDGASTNTFYTLNIIDVPELEPIAIEMTQDTMVFEDKTVPSEEWQTDGFELVLNKMTSEACRYTPRYVQAFSNTKYFVQLQTGASMWPESENAMFTIKKEFLKSGWYAVDFTGVVFAGPDEYSIYVDGKYAGDFVFGDPNAADTPAGRYLNDKTLNTVYIPDGYVEISFRARRANGYAMSYFVPHTITLTPVENQEGLTVAGISSDISAKIPVGESQNVTAHIEMSDGSYRHFGLLDDGSEDNGNKVISVEIEDSSVAEISEWEAPQIGASSEITYTVKAKKSGKTNVLVTSVVDGAEHTEKLPLEVIDKPTLSSVEVSLSKEKLPATRSADADISLVRTGDFKEYTYDKTVVYESSDSDIAEIDAQTGAITAKNEGTVTIYTHVTDWAGNTVTGEKLFTVLPKPELSSINVSVDTELTVGETANITSSAVMNDGLSGNIEDYTLSYESSDTAVAQVSEDGVITAIGVGACVITVSAKNESGKLCTYVTAINVHDALDALVINFSETVTKLDYSQPDTTPGYTILTSIGVPASYRMFDCGGKDMLQIQTGRTVWSQTEGGTSSVFAFAINAHAEGDYGIELFGGEFRSMANYSVYVNGNYAGDYIFYDSEDSVRRAQGEVKTLNTLHLNNGYNEVVIALREMPAGNSAYMLLRSIKFTPRAEEVYFYGIESLIPETVAVGEKINVTAAVRMSDGTLRRFGPDYDTGALEDADNMLTLSDPNGYVDTEKTAVIGDTSSTDFTLTAKTAGTTTLTFTAVVDGEVHTRSFDVEVKDDPLAATGAIIRPEELYEGDSAYLYATPTLESGRVIDDSAAESYYVSKNEDIATVDGNVITAHKTGTVTVEVTTVFNGQVVKGTAFIEIQEAGMTSVTATAGGSMTIRLTDRENNSVPLYVTATDNFGNEVDLTSTEIEVSTSSACVVMDGNKNIFPQSEGEAVFDVTVTLPDGRMRSTQATLRVVKGKSESTYFTPEEIATARENYKKYDWVKSEYASFISNADKYVDKIDVLYSLIPSEGLPRAICVGDYLDPLAYTCRYCNVDIMNKYGQFSWVNNALSRPWKVQCPDCKRLFPSNDFESFYELGLNEYGEFDRQRALDRHAELFGDKTAPVGSDAWYGYGVKGGYVVEYLKNKSTEIKMRHAKNTASQIRTNIEDGIIREALDSLVDCKISGNFGLPQEANAVCAVVLDSMPETAEWLDYLMAPGWVRSNSEPCTGGSVGEVLMDNIDADGQGDEGSQYNNNWHLALVEIQTILDDYDRYSATSLYNSPKFCRMFYSNIPLMTGYYTPQIGDSGNTASKGFWMNNTVALEGWKHFGDPVFAQILYKLNGNSYENLHYDSLEADPGRLEDEVREVIEKHGELDLESEAMTNFGFAVLRAGDDYSNATGATATDTSRDLWMYYGSSSGHGHCDTLNIGMRAFGLNFMPDLGYPALTGTDPARVQWVKNTIAHNTVVFDEGAQAQLEEPRGEMLHFDDSETVQLIDVSAPYVYDDAEEYRRSVVMINAGDDVSYTVDFFRILGGNAHTYSFHASSNEIAQTSGLSLTAQKKDGVYAGTYAGVDTTYGEDPTLKYPIGYTWLKNVDRDDSPEDSFEIDFKIKDFNKAIKDSSGLRMRMTMLNGTNAADGAKTDVAIADGLPPQKAENENVDKLKYVLVRNRGSNLDTVFTAVLEPYRNTRYLKSSTELTMEAVDGSGGLRRCRPCSSR